MSSSTSSHDVTMSDDYKAAWNDVIKIEGNYENFARRRKKPESRNPEQDLKVAKNDGRKSALKIVNEESKKEENNHEKGAAAEETKKRNTESKEEPINKKGKTEDNVKVAKIKFVERQKKKPTENIHNNNNNNNNINDKENIDTKSKFPNEKFEDSSSRKVVKISMSSENSRKTMTSATKEDGENEVSERDLLEKTRKILGEQSKKANLVKGQNVFLKKKTSAAAASGESPQLLKVSSRKSVSPKSLVSRNSADNNLSFELSVNSFSDPNSAEIPKLKPRKRNKKESDSNNNNNKLPDHFSLYLGVCSQPLPVSIVTSITARPAAALGGGGEKEHFPQSSVRRLPQINRPRDVSSTDNVMIFKPRQRRVIGSPTLGEIALRRKLTDRLPTRKVQKRWPDAQSDFAFDLNIDRRTNNQADGSERNISNRQTALKSKTSTFTLPFIRRKNSRKFHKLTQPNNTPDGGGGELKSRRIASDYDVMGGESVTFRRWIFPEIEHKRRS